jgi:hypothetical protein
MPMVHSIPNPLYSNEPSSGGTPACFRNIQSTTQAVMFNDKELTELELVHARYTARTNFWELARIATIMKERNISYREAFLALHNEGEI